MSNDIWPDPNFEGWSEIEKEKKVWFEWTCMGCGTVQTSDNMHCPCEDERREDG